MPIVEMPDGQRVSFPDDMPRERIRVLIASKYPDSTPKPQDRGFLERTGGITATIIKCW